MGGAGINYGNLANSTKASNDEAQVQARMDSLMMVTGHSLRDTRTTGAPIRAGDHPLRGCCNSRDIA